MTVRGTTTGLALAASVALMLMSDAAAAASCAQELAGLDQRVHRDADIAVSTASGGQGVAAKRNGEAIEARNADRPVKTEQNGPAGGSMETQAVAQAAEAGGAGDRVMQAKVSINNARVAQGKGDETGCLAAVAKAKSQLDR